MFHPHDNNCQECDKGGDDLQCHKPQGWPRLHVLLYTLDKVVSIINNVLILYQLRLNVTNVVCLGGVQKESSYNSNRAFKLLSKHPEKYFEYEDLSNVFHPERELLWAFGEIISASGNSLELSFWIHNSCKGWIANMDLRISRNCWLKYKVLLVAKWCNSLLWIFYAILIMMAMKLVLVPFLVYLALKPPDIHPKSASSCSNFLRLSAKV